MCKNIKKEYIYSSYPSPYFIYREKNKRKAMTACHYIMMKKIVYLRFLLVENIWVFRFFCYLSKGPSYTNSDTIKSQNFKIDANLSFKNDPLSIPNDLF